MNNHSNEQFVYCCECDKQDWCGMRQYMKYTLGIEDAYCAAGVKREDKKE